MGIKINMNRTLLFLMTGTLVFFSCRKEGSYSQDTISFIVRTGSASDTKTSYTGSVSGSREGLTWKKGDLIRVASDLARHRYNTAQNWADYRLKADGTPDAQDPYKSNGLVDPASGSTLPNGSESLNGLIWDGDGTHIFYGLYPSPSWLPTEQQNNAGIQVNASSATLKAFLPSRMPWDIVTNPVTTSQRTNGSTTITTKKIEPDMRYAYMWARNSAQRSSGQGLDLSFYPMITTFDISILGSSGIGELTLEEVELYSESCALHGTWTAEVSRSSPALGANPNPLYGGAGLTYQQDVNDRITVVMPISYNVNGESASTVSSTEEINFKVFVFPRGVAYDTSLQATKYSVSAGQTALTDLYLRFKVTSTGGANQSHYLKLPLAVKDPSSPGTNVNVNSRGFVEFPAGKKINIKNIMLPVQEDPWTFSVSVDDLVEEGPDVVVDPVSVEAFIPQKNGMVDGAMYLGIKNPNDIVFYAGSSQSGLVSSYKYFDEGGSGFFAVVPWTIDGVYPSYEDAIEGTNQLSSSDFVTGYAPISAEGSVYGERVQVDYADNVEGNKQQVWLRIRQTVAGGKVGAMCICRPELLVTGQLGYYYDNGYTYFQ